MSGRWTRKPVERHGFKIGIMCALVPEADMVERVFSEQWNTDYGSARGDPNAYTTGVIAGQNVVLVHCPHMGSNGAAQVAVWLKASFTGIEIIIVVGICGAVPTYKHQQKQEEIWLGDCLISTAVVQFDLGRKESYGFRMKGDLDGLGRPGLLTKGIMAKLQTRNNRSQLTEDLKSHLQALQQEDPEWTAYPGVHHDQLYCVQRCTELGCGNQYHQLRTRPENDNSPSIHFGSFGSSNTVLKSGIDRDELAEAHNIIAFEMESSGVWDVCQTIVIKAACDYADSHKNKIWQKYAAAVAAAGLKAFLSRAGLSDKVQSAGSRIIRRRRSVPSLQFTGWELPTARGYATAIISSDFKMLAYGLEKSARERNAIISVHSLQNGTAMHVIHVEKETQVRSLAFDCKGKILASSHGGYWYKPIMNREEYLPVRIRLWSMETGCQKWICEAHKRKSLKLKDTTPLVTMSFNSKGDRLAAVYSSNDLSNVEKPDFFIINVNNGEVIYKSTGNPPGFRLGHFSPDDRQYFKYLGKEIAVLDADNHKEVFSSIPVSDNDIATFKPDGSFLVVRCNGNIDTISQDYVIKQKLEIESDLSFSKDTRILGRFTTRNELILVVMNLCSQQLYIVSPDSNRCRMLSSAGPIAKVLEISLDGRYLAWCELRAPDSSCQIRVCNIQELQAADISCFLEGMD